MTPPGHAADGSGSEGQNRRGFLSRVSLIGMFSGLLGGYGMFAYIAGRFLYPANPPAKAWMFVTEVPRMQAGDSLAYQAPSGEKIVVTRQRQTGAVEDFLALSSTCPHLGCQVHWQAQHNRYFCPCHNGVFDPTGKGISGPPGEAGQSLPQFPLRITQNLLFIEVPTETLASGTLSRSLAHRASAKIRGRQTTV